MKNEIEIRQVWVWCMYFCFHRCFMFEQEVFPSVFLTPSYFREKKKATCRLAQGSLDLCVFCQRPCCSRLPPRCTASTRCCRKRTICEDNEKKNCPKRKKKKKNPASGASADVSPTAFWRQNSETAPSAKLRRF